ncbi:MAG TPA: ComF family protein [Desulfobacterales bacterium]
MFASRRGGDHLCYGCMQRSRYYHRARAATTYNKVMKRIIHTYKYGGHIRLADPLAALLQDAYRRYWPEGGIDLVLPIPLHRRRFRRRGFNQAYLLMQPRRKTRGALARLPTNLRALVRVRATPAQAGLGRADRRRNIRDAFQVRMPRSVAGRKILLVDDVYTTGATVEECSRVLVQAGAERVEVLTVARAMPGYMAGVE